MITNRAFRSSRLPFLCLSSLQIPAFDPLSVLLDRNSEMPAQNAN